MCDYVLLLAILWAQWVLPCKYPNLNMKFDIRKIVEPKTCTGLPVINGEMENITASTGDKVTFFCQVDYTCMVNSIKWFHTTPDNLTTTHIMPPSTGGDRHVHSISSVTRTDEGSYSCIAENVLGQAIQVAYLAVSGQDAGGGGLA